mmetsp:Transcript_6556/g.10538  ORF Transcript_6556/g.10538 Transcript_6556/m.10538 type:complete len:170 (+) Transcript_6556:90-599(+)
MAAPMSAKAQQMVKNIRPWDKEFLCFGTKKEAFSVPKVEEITPRVSANIEYFAANYLICLMFFSLVAIIVYPQLLVLVCVFSGLWYGVLTRPAHFMVQIGAMQIQKRHLTYGLVVFNVLVVFVFARTHIFATMGASFLFILAHAACHSIPEKKRDDEDDSSADNIKGHV